MSKGYSGTEQARAEQALARYVEGSVGRFKWVVGILGRLWIDEYYGASGSG